MKTANGGQPNSPRVLPKWPPEPKATGSNPVSRADLSRPGTKRNPNGVRADPGSNQKLARPLPVLVAGLVFLVGCPASSTPSRPLTKYEPVAAGLSFVRDDPRGVNCYVRDDGAHGQAMWCFRDADGGVR